MQQVTGILSPGIIVQDRYAVEELLGRGGFGAVYRVRDQKVSGQLFALKEIADPSRQGRNRLIHEWKLLQQLHHPALPRVYRVFDSEQGDRAYLLMEYIEGTNLEILRRQQPEKSFSLSEVFVIIAPIIDALAYLHHQQPPILHRDIKPANIILTTTGDKAVLVDFGIAKEYDPDDTTTTLRHCSPGYGAPEQYSTGTDTRTDIYGLGATLYALITGLVPADALHRMTRLGNTGMDPLKPVNQIVPAVPTFVAEAIHRALSLRSGDRFSTVEQFWEALLVSQTRQPSPVLLSSQSMFADPSAATMQVRRGSPAAFSQKRLRSFRSRSLGVLLLVLLALVIGVGLGMGFWSAVVGQRGADSASPVTPQHTATAAPATPGPTSTPGNGHHGSHKKHHNGDGSDSGN
jgi:eukaryotic-like serine/threonine-protein kinase